MVEPIYWFYVLWDRSSENTKNWFTTWRSSLREHYVSYLRKSNKPKSVRTPQNITIVKQSVKDDRKQSTMRRTPKLVLSWNSFHRFLCKDLNLHKLTNRPFGTPWLLRFHFRTRSNWYLSFSEETHFILTGTVNKPNRYIWVNSNLRECQEHCLYLQKVTLECTLWSKEPLGLIFQWGRNCQF